MFVDASAIVAILVGEPEGRSLANAIDQGHGAVTSVIAAWEAAVALYRRKQISMLEANETVKAFLETANIQMIGITSADLGEVLEAFARYGCHRYADDQRNRGLNLADCVHYDSAKARSLPILHKDLGLAATDIASVARST